MKRIHKIVLAVPVLFVLGAIRVYQKTVSPDHGFFSRFFPPTCRFYPTCSEYGHEAIERFGVLKGGALTVKRVFRCHPWAKGGVDAVPMKS